MGDRIRQQNFDQICRLCLEYASNINKLFPIFINKANVTGFYGRFIEEFKESVSEIISSCIGVQVDPNDRLPMNICTNCEKQLVTSNQFRRKCLMSNEYLLEVRLTSSGDFVDAHDDLPKSSLKHPELILVNSIKEENEHEVMDSSCESVWNCLKEEAKHEDKVNEERLVKTEYLRKSARKRSRTITIPLVTPSTDIVPEVIDCNKSVSNKELNGTETDTNKRRYVKKPKMCTVCGMIVKRLRDHMKSHPDALEIKCQHCPNRYLTEKGLTKHMRIQHVEDSKPLAKSYTWKRNNAKIQHNFGQTYISSKGIVKPEKKIKEPCNHICRIKCTSKITNFQREEIFKHFWNISDLTQKRVFVVRHIEQVIPKYRRARGLRSLNYAYFFEIDGQRIQVCKTFFKRTLDISDVFIKTAINKLNSEKGYLEGDRRGKSKNVKM